MMSEPLSRQQVQQIELAVRTAIREELADAGLRLDGGTHQDEAREDFRFLRKLRRGIDGTSAKIGWAVIAAIIGAAIWIFTQGINFWRGA